MGLNIKRQITEEIIINHCGEVLNITVSELNSNKVALVFGGSREFRISRGEKSTKEDRVLAKKRQNEKKQKNKIKEKKRKINREVFK